ncbi:MAG: adenosyl-hopene transferase HpnH [Chloroflexi bacterium]|nr:adenosyl-hopene transferase HpnH [Chloroflexota bacterium]
MGPPLKQAVKVGSYLVKQKVLRRDKFPLVLMLEPLWRCNLACAGCGKIQHPEPILKKMLTPQECWDAAEECGAPVVSIAGGEPLIHPQIGEIIDGFVERGRFVYLCTNAILLERSLPKLKPSAYLTIDVHMDGLEKAHDASVCRDGVFATAVSGMRAAKAACFRIATNTTVFDNTDPDDIIALFDFLTFDIKVDGIMVSPGYSYEKAPRQDIFLKRQRTHQFFREILKHKRRWPLTNTPLYLGFLQGDVQLQCTPWGMPNRNVMGWQKPCYVMAAEGQAASYKELLQTTNWDKFGYGRDPRCENCMIHSGYEASAVLAMMADARNLIRSVKLTMASGVKEPAPVAG